MNKFHLPTYQCTGSYVLEVLISHQLRPCTQEEKGPPTTTVEFGGGGRRIYLFLSLCAWLLFLLLHSIFLSLSSSYLFFFPLRPRPGQMEQSTAVVEEKRHFHARSIISKIETSIQHITSHPSFSQTSNSNDHPSQQQRQYRLHDE